MAKRHAKHRKLYGSEEQWKYVEFIEDFTHFVYDGTIYEDLCYFISKHKNLIGERHNVI